MTLLSRPQTEPFSGATGSGSPVGRRSRRRRGLVCAGLAGTLTAVLAMRVLLGDYTVTIPDFIRILAGEQIPGASFIVWESKLPRAVAAAVGGAAFGAAGVVMQSVLRNPLASPDIIGLSLGASAAAVTAIVVFGLSGGAVTAAALGGALAVAAVIVAVGGGSPRRMVLAGIGLAATCQALVQWLLMRADIYRAHDAMVWLTGSVSDVTWSQIVTLALALALLLPALMLLQRRLDTLELGDDLARGLGLSVTPLRGGALLLAVVATAIATSVCGPVAFVALLSGPISRHLLGGGLSVPAAATVGASIVVAADYAAAYALPGVNLPVGVITGMAGAPFLLMLVLRAGRLAKVTR